jgi:hypothetical protein
VTSPLSRLGHRLGSLPTPTLLTAGAVVILLLLGLNAVVLLGDRGDDTDLEESVINGASTPDPAPPATETVTPTQPPTAAPSPSAAPPPGDDPPAAPSAAPTATAAAPAPVPTSGVQATLPVGTCVVVPSRPTHVRSVTPLDCAEEHSGEVFVSVVLTQPADAPYPGRDALEQDSRSLCQGQAFESYVGVAYGDSQLFAYVLAPTEETWATGDRDVSCFLSDITGPMVGSQQGSAR